MKLRPVLMAFCRLVIFRLGRFHGIRGPGLSWVIPAVDQKVRVDVRRRKADPGDFVATEVAGFVGAGRESGDRPLFRS